MSTGRRTILAMTGALLLASLAIAASSLASGAAPSAAGGGVRPLGAFRPPSAC